MIQISEFFAAMGIELLPQSSGSVRFHQLITLGSFGSICLAQKLRSICSVPVHFDSHL